MLIDGRYEIGEKIGSGGFGETFLGIDTRSPSSSKIVIKQLSYYNRDKSSISEAETSEVRRRFRIEAEVLEKLSMVI